MAPKNDPNSAEWQKRQLIWKHNSFFGHAKLAERNMYAIMRADTTTQETKQLANRIAAQLSDLYIMLQDRDDRNMPKK